MVQFTLAWILIVFVLLWFGNRMISRILNQILTWKQYGNIRFFTQLLVGILYSLLIANGTYAALKLLLTVDPPTVSQLVVMNVYGSIIFIPAYSVYFSLHFLRNWRKSEVESARHQKESMRSRLETLKSHLDPHFLFNNLNILSSLIQTDKEKSQEFLHTFAEVYRMLLKTKSEDLIPLSEEIRFITSYCYLLEARFGDCLSFQIDVPENIQSRLIPPLTLQMLLENAIKHNQITEKKPLTVSITASGDVISVANSLNPKPQPTDKTEGSGLNNIRRRFDYFSDQPIRIESDETTFRVHLPLL
ncbi:MAG TPA: histidine kinase [Catalimonadaceae bacterium]|nr:histidine kinase [Catalimonadaceae bacterium]HPI10603.1 histidine kinase [Catalimonadaceae bacterium]